MGVVVLEVPTELLLFAMDQPIFTVRSNPGQASAGESASHVLLVRRGALITNWHMVVHDLGKVCVDICRGHAWLFAGCDSIVCKRVYRDVVHGVDGRSLEISCLKISRQVKRWMNQVKQGKEKGGEREVEDRLAKSEETPRIDALMRC